MSWACTRSDAGALIDGELQYDDQGHQIGRYCSARPAHLHSGDGERGYHHARPSWEAAPAATPSVNGSGHGVVSVESPLAVDTTLLTHPARDARWPQPLADEALSGLAGDVVRAVDPYTEADPAAILVHFLAGVGILLGMQTRMVVGDAPHPGKLNALFVGATGHGRKGTARQYSRTLLLMAEPTFTANTAEGLSSGEGLIFQVRDPIRKIESVGKGADRHLEEIVIDEGVTDKRLSVGESEFASVLRMIQREGNVLGAVVRRAWDGDDLRTMTKNSPVRATGAHVGITGDVSREELLRYLDRSELANGFVNRFLIVATKRSKLLPDGASVPDEILRPLGDRLRAVRAWAQANHVLQRDEDARQEWHRVYPDLTQDRPGMFGMATSRAEAQVVRLSVVYAALDCSEVIRLEHLRAALAVWGYCSASARWVFGDATGDPTADAILSALRRGDELGRNEIYELLGRHVNRSRIERALGLLLSAGLAQARREPTDGRPREVWRATKQ